MFRNTVSRSGTGQPTWLRRPTLVLSGRTVTIEKSPGPVVAGHTLEVKPFINFARDYKSVGGVVDLGIQIITTGNHLWDRWTAKALLAKERNILRPLNYPKENAGNGFVIYDLKEKGKIGVVRILRTDVHTVDRTTRSGLPIGRSVKLPTKQKRFLSISMPRQRRKNGAWMAS